MEGGKRDRGHEMREAATNFWKGKRNAGRKDNEFLERQMGRITNGRNFCELRGTEKKNKTVMLNSLSASVIKDFS